MSMGDGSDIIDLFCEVIAVRVYEVKKLIIRNGLRTATALPRKSNEHANSQM